MITLPEKLRDLEFTGYVTVPAAMNRIGSAIYPDYWYNAPSFDQLPYRLVDDERYEWKGLRFLEESWEFVVKRTKPHGPRATRVYLLAESIYWQAAKQLVLLVQAGEIGARLFDLRSKKGAFEFLPGELTLSAQFEIVFFTGFIQVPSRPRATPHEAPRKWARKLVLVEEKGLARWLRTAVGKTDRPRVSAGARSMARTTVAAFCQRHNTTMDRSWLKEVVDAALLRTGRRLTDEDFDRDLWALLPNDAKRSTGGVIRADAGQRRKRAREELITELSTVLRAESQAAMTADIAPANPT
ncbi:MAG: hypothetical protein ACWA6X_00825 [Bauldia sp.]